MDTKKDLSSLPATPAGALDGRAPELGVASGSAPVPTAWLCREASGAEYLLYLGGQEAKPNPLWRAGRADTWTWGNGFENVVIFTPKEWAKISPVVLNPGAGPVPLIGSFAHLPNTRSLP